MCIEIVDGKLQLCDQMMEYAEWGDALEDLRPLFHGHFP